MSKNIVKTLFILIFAFSSKNALSEIKIMSNSNSYTVQDFPFSTTLYGQSIEEITEEAAQSAFEELKRQNKSVSDAPFSKELILDFSKHSENITNKNYSAIYEFTFSKIQITKEKKQANQLKYVFGTETIFVTLKVKNNSKLKEFFTETEKLSSNMHYTSFIDNKITIKFTGIYKLGITEYLSSKYTTFSTEDGNLVIKL
jgi:hypothetical protein